MVESGAVEGAVGGGLTGSGKVGPAAASALILLTVMLGGCGHSDSWQYGYNHAAYAHNYWRKGASEEASCQIIARDAGAKVNTTEAVKGCLAGLKDMGK